MKDPVILDLNAEELRLERLEREFDEDAAQEAHLSNSVSFLRNSPDDSVEVATNEIDTDRLAQRLIECLECAGTPSEEKAHADLGKLVAEAAIAYFGEFND
jgi:hypothetical protein